GARAVRAVPEPALHAGPFGQPGAGRLDRAAGVGARDSARRSPAAGAAGRVRERSARNGRNGATRVHGARLAAAAAVLRFVRLRAGRAGQARRLGAGLNRQAQPMTFATFVPIRISFSSVGRGMPRTWSYQPDSSSRNSSIVAMRSLT